MLGLLHLVKTEYLHNDISSILSDAKFMTLHAVIQASNRVYEVH